MSKPSNVMFLGGNQTNGTAEIDVKLTEPVMWCWRLGSGSRNGRRLYRTAAGGLMGAAQVVRTQQAQLLDDRSLTSPTQHEEHSGIDCPHHASP